MRYSLRLLLLIVLVAALALAGYLVWEQRANTWTVDRPEPIGLEILQTEHGEFEGGGGYLLDTYGILIRNGDKSKYLLWENGECPFDLKDGNQIRLGTSIKKRYYDKELDGWHAEPSDIKLLD